MKKNLILSLVTAFLSLGATSVLAADAVTVDSIRPVSSDFKDGISTIKVVLYMSSGEKVEQTFSCELRNYRQDQSVDVDEADDAGYSDFKGSGWQYYRYGNDISDEMAVLLPLNKELPADQKEEKDMPLFGEMILIKPLEKLKKQYPVYLKKRR